MKAGTITSAASEVSAPDGTAARLAAVRQSCRFAASRSPERLAALPSIPSIRRWLPQVIWTGFAVAAVALLIVMATALPHTSGAGRVVLVVALVVPAGFAAFGVALLMRYRRKLAVIDRSEMAIRPAVIVAKRVGAGVEPHDSADGCWLTVELEDGVLEQLEAISKELVAGIAVGQAGILFSRGSVAVEFEVFDPEPSTAGRGQGEG